MSDYDFGKNIYLLYDCAAEFMEDLDETVTYEYTDSRYHTKTTTGGEYCCFCYGTNHEKSSVLERHDLEVDILPAVCCIALTTFLLSSLGVKFGSLCGTRMQSKAEALGGVILILLGLKILLEHLGIF